jgi:hypothetical protein
MVSVKPVTVAVNIEVHECECCQPRSSTELARLRRVNRRLLENRQRLIAELKLAYSKLREARAIITMRPTVQGNVLLLWDSVRRDTEAQRKAAG